MISTNSERSLGREKGNAATITLLALAVAILVGVVVLYFAGKATPNHAIPNAETDTRSTSTASEEIVNPRKGWQTYTDPTYSFTVGIPPGWLVATGTVGLDPVITVAPGALNQLNIDAYHDAPTRVSIYPHGLAGEGLFEEESQSSVIITVPQATARDYRLENKRPWATIARFDVYPQSWTPAGYVFARAAVEDEAFRFFRGRDEIDQQSFDAFMGDRAVRVGYVDPAVRAIEEEILRSLAFVEANDPLLSGGEEHAIEVETPKSGDSVSSPLQLRGTARGSWYFEGNFPVRLETNSGEVLAELPASAEGDWMTEEYVPFELSIVFGTTAATSGALILSKDNPSGIPELDKELRIPLIFGEP